MKNKRRIRQKISRVSALVAAFFMVGCQTFGEDQGVKTGELCIRGDRAKPVLIGHVDERDQSYFGDAPKGQYDGIVKQVPTAVAMPKKGKYSLRYRDDCYDKVKKVWYPCVKEAGVDFSAVRGIARAPGMETARKTAMRLCDMQVREMSPKAGNAVKFNSRHFECEVVQTAKCPVYKATEKQKQQKKKLEDDRRAERRKKSQPRVDCTATSVCDSVLKPKN